MKASSHQKLEGSWPPVTPIINTPCTYVYVYIYIYIIIHEDVNIFIYLYLYIHVYTYTHIYLYIILIFVLSVCLFVCLFVSDSGLNRLTDDHEIWHTCSIWYWEWHGYIHFFINVPVWGVAPPENFNFLTMGDTKNFIDTKNDLHQILS